MLHKRPRKSSFLSAFPINRKLHPKPEEITFDPSSRTEYLTGFHKRKLARKKHAVDVALAREKEERKRERRRMREARKAEVEALNLGFEVGLTTEVVGEGRREEEYTG
ncbi:MAG: hypothetical protein Q9190_006359, partial [Brigantiaea leucoxantha]